MQPQIVPQVGLNRLSCEDGAEERFEAVAVRVGSQVAGRIDERLNRRGQIAGRDGPEPALGHERGDDVLVFLGLAGAGRVDEAAAGTKHARRFGEHLALRGREPREVGFGPAPADVRIAAKRAEPEQGTSSSTQSKDCGQRQRRGIGLNDPHRPGAREPHGPREQIHAPPADIGGDDQAPRRPSPRQSPSSSPRETRRRRARARRSAPRRATRRVATLRPARRSVRCRRGASGEDFPFAPRNASGAKRPGSTCTPCAARDSTSDALDVRSLFARIVSGAGRLLNCSQASVAAKP